MTIITFNGTQYQLKYEKKSKSYFITPSVPKASDIRRLLILRGLPCTLKGNRIIFKTLKDAQLAIDVIENVHPSKKVSRLKKFYPSHSLLPASFLNWIIPQDYVYLSPAWKKDFEAQICDKTAYLKLIYP